MIHQLLLSSGIKLAGQVVFTSPIAVSSTTYSWVVPSGVTTICAVVVGGGGAGSQTTNNTASPGGAGGGVSYRNDIPVTPGETLSITPGIPGFYNYPNASANGQPSAIQRGATILLVAGGGAGGVGPFSDAVGGAGAVSPADGGGDGGDWMYAGPQTFTAHGGGGGAGGYNGKGGRGGITNVVGGNPTSAATNSGGGGGGYASSSVGGGGGGVGLLGQGSDGIAGTSSSVGGQGGSSGGVGRSSANSNTKTERTGGLYGGGGYGRPTGNPGAGGKGAVRIIWGAGRAFPSTNTGDV